MTEDTQTSHIHIPTVEEIARNYTPGLLYSDSKTLYYLDFSTMEKHYLYMGGSAIWDIKIVEEEIYYDYENGKIKSLFTEFKSEERLHNIFSIEQDKKRIVDAGYYGLFSTLDNKILISGKEIEAKGYDNICSLASHEGTLYALLEHHECSSLLKIAVVDGLYYLGREILSWQGGNDHVPMMEIIPYGSMAAECASGGDFSVVSSVGNTYLDVNGLRIIGTEAEAKEYIHTFTITGLVGNNLELLYTGDGMNRIVKAKIDLQKKEVLEKEDFVKDCFGVCAMEAVTDYDLHQKLIDHARRK